MKQLLRKLTETASPSGYESRIRDLVRQEISGLSNQVSVDTLGNLIVRIGEKSAAGKIPNLPTVSRMGQRISPRKAVAAALFDYKKLPVQNQYG